MHERAFILLGSNIEAEANLPLAIQELKRLGKPITTSGVYQNPAIGNTAQPDFLNAAVLLKTDIHVLELRSQLRTIEAGLGRVRTTDKYAPRTIDLDLCLFERLIIQSPDFTIPDPEILIRAHVAIPLADLDPGYKHPITDESLRSIADRLRPDAELTPRADVEDSFRSVLEVTSSN